MGTRGRLATLLLGAAGCITSAADRGTPLYTAPSPLPPQQVALLSGYVASVDGRDVSRVAGGLFELLPGCHVIRTPTRWGEANNTGGVVAPTGSLTFVLPMTAGNRYDVVVDTGGTGPVAFSVSVRADETTAAGQLVRRIGPATSAQEIEDCRRQP